MKRRDFLKASALSSSVALLDACAKEEVQYIKQAVRRSNPPGTSVWRPGVCQQCSAGCGIEVRTIDGDAKKIEGNPQHPVNRGGVCALGQASLQGLYDPDRIATPLKRLGNRGAGKFEKITWEEALREIGEALAAAQSRDPQGVTIVTGTSSALLRGLLRRLTQAVGATPLVVCQAHEAEVERAASKIAFGIEDFPAYDLSHSDYILSVGAPFLDRWRSPVHYARGLAEMRRGRAGRRGKLVQAEARMSITAATADEWLPLLPGSEGIFAQALAGVIISEELAAPTAIEKYRTLLASDPPELTEATKLCDLPPEKIRRIARELAGAENRVVMGGGMAAAHTNGLFNLVAILGLNLLLETLGHAGGVFSPVSFNLDKSLDLATASTSEVRSITLAKWARHLRNDSASAKEVLLVCEADPLHVAPRGWQLTESLQRMNRVIALTSFLDDTALHADIILPLHTDLERVDLVEPSPSVGIRALGLGGPAVEPVVDSRHPGDLILALATALGEPVASIFPWPSYANLLETQIRAELGRLSGGQKVNFQKYLKEAHSRGGIWEEKPPSESPPGPTEKAPAPTRLRREGQDDTYPFHLIPFESVKIGDGRGANRSWLQELPDPLTTVMWGSWAEISLKDAEHMGIVTGDQLRIESPTGTIEVPAIVSPAVRPGLVAIPLGPGHRDFGRYARTRGANPLDLLGDWKVEGTDAPAWAATRVRLQRIGKGSVALFGPGLRVHEETVKRA